MDPYWVLFATSASDYDIHYKENHVGSMRKMDRVLQVYCSEGKQETLVRQTRWNGKLTEFEKKAAIFAIKKHLEERDAIEAIWFAERQAPVIKPQLK